MIPGFRVVPPEGPLDASVMIVGESPGEQESYAGRAFVGPSGDILWPLLQIYMGLVRSEVRLINLVQLNTWGREESDTKKAKAMLAGIEEWGPSLLSDIDTVEPELIVAVGRWSVSFLLEHSADSVGRGLSKLELHRLTMETVNGKLYQRRVQCGGRWLPVVILPVLHPAYAIRSKGSSLQLISWAMTQGREYLEGKRRPVPVLSDLKRYDFLAVGDNVPITGAEGRCIGLDTEGSTKRPHSIQVSMQDDLGFAVSANDALGLYRLSIYLSGASEIVVHHILHDLPVCRAMGIDLDKIAQANGIKLVCTMIAAHQLGGAGDDEDTAGEKKKGPSYGIEPLGLKPLVLRHLGIVMQTYKGLVRPWVRKARWGVLGTLLLYLETLYRLELDTLIAAQAHPGFTKAGKPRKPKKVHLKPGKPLALLLSAKKRHDAGKAVNLDGLYTGTVAQRNKGGTTWQKAGIPALVKGMGLKWPNDSNALVDGLVPESEWVPYACDDATLARRVWLEELKPRLEAEGLMPVFELNMARMPLIDDMRSRGMYIDTKAEKTLLVEWSAEVGILDDMCRMVFGKGPEFNPGAPPQVAKLLFEELDIPAPKLTKKKQFSTAGDVLESVQHYHNGIGLLIQRRDTATQLRFVKEGRNADESSRLYPDISMVRTVSDRLASSDPNFLAWPKHGPKALKIRKCYKATPGYVLLEEDYSQVEIRVFAHRSGEPSLCDAINRGVDVHKWTALEILGKDDDVSRQIFKTTNFAILYLCSPPTLQAQLAAEGIFFTLLECEEIQRRWFARFPLAKSYIQAEREKIIRTGEVRDSWGGRRYLPGSRLPGRTWPAGSMREEALRQGNNYLIQTDSQREMSEAMVRVKREVLPQFAPGDVYPLLQIHDALLMEVREELASKLHWLMRAAMENTTRKYRVPILVDGKIGHSWGTLCCGCDTPKCKKKYDPTPL